MPSGHDPAKDDLNAVFSASYTDPGSGNLPPLTGTDQVVIEPRTVVKRCPGRYSRRQPSRVMVTRWRPGLSGTLRCRMSESGWSSR